MSAAIPYIDLLFDRPKHTLLTDDEFVKTKYVRLLLNKYT